MITAISVVVSGEPVDGNNDEPTMDVWVYAYRWWTKWALIRRYLARWRQS